MEYTVENNYPYPSKYILSDSGEIFIENAYVSNETWRNIVSEMEFCKTLPRIKIYSYNSSHQRVYLEIYPCEMMNDKIYLNIQLQIVDKKKQYDSNNLYNQSTGTSPRETYSIVMHLIRFAFAFIPTLNLDREIYYVVTATNSRRFNIYKKVLYKLGFRLVNFEGARALVLNIYDYNNIYNDKIVYL